MSLLPARRLKQDLYIFQLLVYLMESMPQNKIPSRVSDKLRAMPDKDLPAHAKARAEMHLDDLRSVLRGME